MSILFAISNVSGKSRHTIYKGQFKTILRFGQESVVTYLLLEGLSAEWRLRPTAGLA